MSNRSACSIRISAYSLNAIREKKEAKQFNKRVLIVFYLLFSAAILPFSGLMAPETSHHGIEGLRFLAMAFYNVAAIVFIVSAAVYVKYNRKAIISYPRDKQVKLIRYPREMALAGAAVMVAILLATIHVVSNQ